MNIGMDKAKGEYIGIVESDDYADPKMFEALYKTAKQFDADVVKSDYYIFHHEGKKLRVNINRLVQNSGIIIHC